MIAQLVDLACACPHLSTSQGLEELATDLIGKASELENLKWISQVLGQTPIAYALPRLFHASSGR